MRGSKKEIQVFTISFLDVLSCALGAIIILFVIVPIGPPSPAPPAVLAPSPTPTPPSPPVPAPPANKTASVPTLFGLPLEAEYAVYIIDVSKSMDKQIENLYQTIESLLMSSKVVHFRFIYFDDDTYSSMPYWPGGWLDGTLDNKKTELERADFSINSLIQSEPVRTNSNAALLEALELNETDVIYFITDGNPTVGETNVDRILSNVKRMNRNNAIINSIMVGLPSANELYNFLHDLAEQNGGVYIGR